MKFMLMMQAPSNAWELLAAWSPADFKAHIEFMLRHNKKLTESGELVLAEGLDMPANAKLVSSKTGEVPPITDGPFPETKEFLAGFWIVDCESEARALKIAAEASIAPGPGGLPLGIPIEVRQVMCAPDFGG